MARAEAEFGERLLSWPRQVPGPTIAIAGGVVLGVASRIADRLPEPLASFGNLGWPWLAVAFAVGAAGSRPWLGGLYGGGALLIAVVSYYGTMFFSDYGLGVVDIGTMGLPSFVAVWLGLSVVGGPLFGGAGAVWAGAVHPWRSASVALLAGAIVGESLALLLIGASFSVVGALVPGLAIGSLLPMVLLPKRGRRIAYLLVVGIALIVVVAVTLLPALLHRIT